LSSRADSEIAKRPGLRANLKNERNGFSKDRRLRADGFIIRARATIRTDGFFVRAGFRKTCALRAPTVFSLRMKSASAKKTRLWLTPNAAWGFYARSPQLCRNGDAI
jgi:hypothetical protein